MQQHDREISALQAEVSRQLRVQESLEHTIRTESESASRQANEVDILRNALREVRELAEGAQTKAASTEARLEAEVSPLKTAAVVPSNERPAIVPVASAPAATCPASPGPPPPSRCNSAISPDFPKHFEDFKTKQFTLLWRGSRDGFGARGFHNRCDGHPNTLTVILDTNGNIFGGFTPAEWGSWAECTSERYYKADPSIKSFLFTLKNPHNVPARRFALKAEKKDEAIIWNFSSGPSFGDLRVVDNCNTNNWSHIGTFGQSYTNDTGLDGKTFFTGSEGFRVKEIEVFEITD
jgi:hypothetical protein